MAKILSRAEWNSFLAESWSKAVKSACEDEIKAAVLAEREACAAICETPGLGAKFQGDVYANAIRARTKDSV